VIAGEQIENTKKNKDELKKMKELVDEAYKTLVSGKDDFTDFGKLLNETWMLKRRLSSKITNSEIDDIYETAINNGAVGGKLLGAGGGGFIVFYAEPENQKRLKEALKKYLHIPFRFDFTGSDIIVYKPIYHNNNGNYIMRENI
jgi:D-glycero-alpha-D-manno-heptose-7-phosphate kinase